jgi:hypothetical protein
MILIITNSSQRNNADKDHFPGAVKSFSGRCVTGNFDVKKTKSVTTNIKKQNDW